jgi:hypothetical protein
VSDISSLRANRKRRARPVAGSWLSLVVPCSSGPLFAESLWDDCRASATELAEARRLGTRSDRLAVARPAEQHGEVNANEALLQLVRGGRAGSRRHVARNARGCGSLAAMPLAARIRPLKQRPAQQIRCLEPAVGPPVW